MLLRNYVKTDCAQLARLFYDTVHTVNAKDYTQEQLAAWATGKVNLEAWNESLQAHHTVVAEVDGKIVGFGDMDEIGYLDRLYVHKDYQRRGAATAICDALEQNTEAAEFTTHASITARPFVSFNPCRKAKDRPAVWMTVTFGLGYRKESPRIDVATEPYPGRWTHHVMVGTPDEIDGELMDWIQELWLNKGSTYEANVVPRDDICIIKHGLKIPIDAENYESFVSKMQVSESEFRQVFIG